jgi:hypothetical protein
VALRPKSGSWPPLTGLRDHSHWTHQPVAETSTWQLTTDRHPCPDEIRTPNPSKQAATDPQLTPRGHWNRHTFYIKCILSCEVWDLVPEIQL